MFWQVIREAYRVHKAKKSARAAQRAELDSLHAQALGIREPEAVPAGTLGPAVYVPGF